MDSAGICWPPGKPCKVVSNCELTTEDLCDMTDGLCVLRIGWGYDCDPNIKKQCQEGLECSYKSFLHLDGSVVLWVMCRARLK